MMDEVGKSYFRQNELLSRRMKSQLMLVQMLRSHDVCVGFIFGIFSNLNDQNRMCVFAKSNGIFLCAKPYRFIDFLWSSIRWK